MNRRLFAISACFSLFLGCAIVEERPSGARLAVTYATLKIIDGDADRADRVRAIAEQVKTYANDDPQLTVDLLIRQARALIEWDRLDAADTALVDTLLIELAARLKEELGEDLIPVELRVTVVTVADWVIAAAA